MMGPAALQLPPLLLLLDRLRGASAPWTPVAYQTNAAVRGFDTHGPCPHGSTYPAEDCDATKGEVVDGHPQGEFRALECYAGALFGGVSLRGFALCDSHTTACWAQAGTVFAKLPPGCLPGGAVATSFAAVTDFGPSAHCKGHGSAINVAADGSLSLAAAVPSGCWALQLDGVGHSLWGLPFLLFTFVATAAYVLAGVGLAVRSRGAPATLSSHPHFRGWMELRALVQRHRWQVTFLAGLSFSRRWRCCSARTAWRLRSGGGRRGAVGTRGWTGRRGVGAARVAAAER